MAFLPRFLAKYVCNRFHCSHPQLVLDPSGKLSYREIVNMVQVVHVKANAGRGTLPGTIASFNVLAVRHPAVAGQVCTCLFSDLAKCEHGAISHVYGCGQI